MKAMAHIRLHQAYHYDSFHISIDAIVTIILQSDSIGSGRWQCLECSCYRCVCHLWLLLVQFDPLDVRGIHPRFVHDSYCSNYFCSRGRFHVMANVCREHFHWSLHHRTVRLPMWRFHLQLNVPWCQMGRRCVSLVGMLRMSLSMLLSSTIPLLYRQCFFFLFDESYFWYHLFTNKNRQNVENHFIVQFFAELNAIRCLLLDGDKMNIKNHMHSTRTARFSQYFDMDFTGNGRAYQQTDKIKTESFCKL